MKDIESHYCKKYYSRKTVVMRVALAESLLAKARGMLFSKGNLGEVDALYLKGCRAVHTLGMSYPIDIAFVDTRLRVTRTLKNVRPGVLKVSQCGAHGVLERKSSSHYWPKTGDQLVLEYVGGGKDEDLSYMQRKSI